MAWLAVDKNGLEYIYDTVPYRNNDNKVWSTYGNYFELPKGAIEKLIGKELTWDDEPIELE